MQSGSIPPPDLRIIRTESVHPHEEHDTQRSLPLIERIQHDDVMINPPIVAAMGVSQFVVLDGANRCHAFQHLGYPHILVQVVSYESGFVELQTWQHIISGWDAEAFLDHLNTLKEIRLVQGQDANAIAHILFRDGQVYSVGAAVATTHERNAVLRQVVAIYQQNAHLFRTATSEPSELWPLYPKAVALVVFPKYTPQDIIAAAKYQAYLPPGISRHIVHGRALRVNYPMLILRDHNTRLMDKNAQLVEWMQDKLAQRQIRYYAEPTYQFDE